jgi:hypothetical protein
MSSGANGSRGGPAGWQTSCTDWHDPLPNNTHIEADSRRSHRFMNARTTRVAIAPDRTPPARPALVRVEAEPAPRTIGLPPRATQRYGTR